MKPTVPIMIPTTGRDWPVVGEIVDALVSVALELAVLAKTIGGVVISGVSGSVTVAGVVFCGVRPK